MSLQLNCRDMWKYVTWYDTKNRIGIKRISTRFQLRAHERFVEWPPEALQPRYLFLSGDEYQARCRNPRENIITSCDNRLLGGTNILVSIPVVVSRPGGLFRIQDTAIIHRNYEIFKIYHNCLITVTSKWARWCLKSPASPSFTHAFIQVQIKENIKAPRHWPQCGEFTSDRWIPRTNGQ